MASKEKFASWEKLAKAVDAAERERLERRGAPPPPARPRSSMPSGPPVDAYDQLRKRIAKHRAKSSSPLPAKADARIGKE
jgi:hypothetical protein